ncbi:MAG: hypothetical protein FWD16_01815 [Clostridia bacterium]|nr:hypothetical protein [Clostridia bacterium]
MSISEIINDIKSLQNDLQETILVMQEQYTQLSEMEDADPLELAKYKDALDSAILVSGIDPENLQYRYSNDSAKARSELEALLSDVSEEKSELGTYQAQLVDLALKKAKAFADKGDYAEALKLLPVSSYYPEVVQKKLETTRKDIGEKWITKTLSRVEELVTEKRYDRAIEDLDEVLVFFPDETRINERKTQIIKDKPVALYELKVVQSSGYDGYAASEGDFYQDEMGDWHSAGKVLTDSYGNFYSGVYYFWVQTGWSGRDALAIYNLDKKYTKFSATVMVLDDSHDMGSGSIRIYKAY